MSDVSAMVAELIAAGCTPEAAASVVARAFVAGVASASFRGIPVDKTAEKRREYDRERKRKVRGIPPESTGHPRNSETSSLSIEEERDQKKEKKERVRATALPDGWRPDADQWQAAVDRLGSVQRTEQELQKFKNHALDKGRVSKRWGAAWANWVDRAIVYAGGPNGNGTGQARTDQASGRAPPRDATVIAGMAGALDRRRAARAAAEAEDAGIREGRGAGAAGGPDPEPGAADGDQGTCGQFALLPAANTG